jgi:hypothetical protein
MSISKLWPADQQRAMLLREFLHLCGKKGAAFGVHWLYNAPGSVIEIAYMPAGVESAIKGNSSSWQL